MPPRKGRPEPSFEPRPGPRPAPRIARARSAAMTRATVAAMPPAERPDGLIELRLRDCTVTIGIEALEHRLGSRTAPAGPSLGHFLEAHRTVSVGVHSLDHPVDTALHAPGRRG